MFSLTTVEEISQLLKNLGPRKMAPRIIAIAVFLSFIALGLAKAQSTSDNVDVCELQRNPSAYNHKLITVRSHLTLAFEDFSLDPENCPRARGTGWVWLELGGDAGPQAMYCCGDHSRPKGVNLEVERISIPLKEDVYLKQMMRLLVAERDKAPTGKPCYGCRYFRVYATLTGRFFAGEPGGYGHMGCCSLLAIQEVSDVTAERTKIPIGGHFSCTHKTWFWPRAVTRQQIALQRSAMSGEDDWRIYSMKRVALEAIHSKTSEWSDEWSLEINEHWPGDQPFPIEADGTWDSEDRLISFSIKLQRPRELLKYAHKRFDIIWVPVKLTQDICTFED